MSPYIYAGATLALAGIIDTQQRHLDDARRRGIPNAHPLGISACRVCRAVIRNKLRHWLDQQTRSGCWRHSFPVAPSDPYWMAA